MSQTLLRVATPPERPLLVYDGDCNFCKLWVRRWHRSSEGRFDCVPLQESGVSARFPELSRGQFEKAVHFIGADGGVFSGAEAIFRALACHPQGAWLLEWHLDSPLFAKLAESTYGFVARRRSLFSFLTRLAWGKQLEPPSYAIVRWAFLRLLGLIYLAAFLSLWPQVTGLIGAQGILPARDTMAAVRSEMNLRNIGVGRYRLAPTFCWLSTTDRFLRGQCAAGAVLAILLVAGVAPVPCLVLLWLLYLSLTFVGRDFLSFQWDSLLLETGLFAIFFAPLDLRPRWPLAPPPAFALWLLRWLLFLLMFESGCVKLMSGDPTWRNLTALDFHYETQPLPTWIGWYAFQLPASLQKASTVVMFVIELGLPFLIFAPRRPRQLACLGFALLQICILLTGNYGFFNYLTLALSLLLLDDGALKSILRRLRLSRFFPETKGEPAGATLAGDGPTGTRRRPFVSAFKFCGRLVAAVAVLTSLMQLAFTFHFRGPWPRPLIGLYAAVAPLRSFDNYGLFAVMTTSRLEIQVEGSQDGMTWLPYVFKYKPGPTTGRPKFVAPHQPRLDWQMWFAALSDYQHNPWFVTFCRRLLQGSPGVLSLLQHNPFSAAPPRYVRAVVWRYQFTNFAARPKSGDWWRREPLGPYLPPVSLVELSAD